MRANNHTHIITRSYILAMNPQPDTSFILKKTKKSGNYTILRKCAQGDKNTVRTIRHTLYGVWLPFGCEEYNGNTIINAVISIRNNTNYNTIAQLNKIIRTFEHLRETEIGQAKYMLGDKTFFPFMVEVHRPDPAEPIEPPESPDPPVLPDQPVLPVLPVLSNQPDPSNQPVLPDQPDYPKKYKLRLYLKYGAKITHARHVGELPPSQVRGKRCTVTLELGSMWVRADKKKYGINVYCTHITVLR